VTPACRPELLLAQAGGRSTGGIKRSGYFAMITASS